MDALTEVDRVAFFVGLLHSQQHNQMFDRVDMKCYRHIDFSKTTAQQAFQLFCDLVTDYLLSKTAVRPLGCMQCCTECNLLMIQHRLATRECMRLQYYDGFKTRRSGVQRGVLATHSSVAAPPRQCSCRGCRRPPCHAGSRIL